MLGRYQSWSESVGKAAATVTVLYSSEYGYGDRLSQTLARGITKAGVATEMVDALTVDAQVRRSCCLHCFWMPLCSAAADQSALHGGHSLLKTVCISGARGSNLAMHGDRDLFQLLSCIEWLLPVLKHVLSLANA